MFFLFDGIGEFIQVPQHINACLIHFVQRSCHGTMFVAGRCVQGSLGRCMDDLVGFHKREKRGLLS